MAAWGFSSSLIHWGPHTAEQPCPCYPKPPLETNPNVPFFLKYSKVSMVTKFKCVSFLTRCLQSNFRWNLGHEEGQAAQFEIALDFLLLSSLPTAALWAKSLRRWLSKGVLSKVTLRKQDFNREHLIPHWRMMPSSGSKCGQVPYKSLHRQLAVTGDGGKSRCKD